MKTIQTFSDEVSVEHVSRSSNDSVFVASNNPAVSEEPVAVSQFESPVVPVDDALVHYDDNPVFSDQENSWLVVEDYVNESSVDDQSQSSSVSEPLQERSFYDNINVADDVDVISSSGGEELVVDSPEEDEEVVESVSEWCGNPQLG